MSVTIASQSCFSGPTKSLDKTITEWGSSTDVDPLGLDLLSVRDTLKLPTLYCPMTYKPPQAMTTHRPSQQLLVCDPAKRLSATASLSHLYFDDLDKSVYVESVDPVGMP